MTGGGATNALAPAATPRIPVSASPLGPLSLVGPGAEKAQAMAAQGKAGGDIADEMIARGEELPAALKRIDMMTGALQGFQAGGGAVARSQFAQALQAARNAGATFIDQDMIDKVGNQSLTDSQIFQSEVKPLAIGQLKEAAQGTGRVMRSEVDAFLHMMDASKDPATLMNLMNQARYTLQVGYDQSQKWTDYKQALARDDPSVRGLGPSDFFSWYNKNFSPSALPTSNVAGGINLGPVPVGIAKGAAPAPAITHRWVPGQGLVPVEPQ